MTGHSLIVGMSGSGKSTLGILIAKESVKRKTKVFVCDPMQLPVWKEIGCVVFGKGETFINAVKQERSALLIVDEGGESIGRDARMNFLTTRARHYGHTTIVIAHRPTQLSNVLRDSCDRLFLFQSSTQAKQTIGEEWCVDDLDRMVILPFHFVMLTRYHKPRRGKVTPDSVIWIDKLEPIATE